MNGRYWYPVDMASIVVLVLTLLAAASAAPGRAGPERIVGGTPTSIEEFPYIVALVYTYPGPGITVQRCVGSLVSSWHVLTNAFCFTGAINDNMKVRAGSTNSLSGGTLVGLGEVIKHPAYLEVPRQGDIAVTFLATPLGITSVIDVLYLPPANTYIPDNTQTKVVSWGFEYEGGPQLDLLKTVNLYKVNIDQCVAQYAGNGAVQISDNVICAAAADRGICVGDSGAPMTIDQVMVGLSSYFETCELNGYPDVFTRIDMYTTWVLEVATAPSAAVRSPGIMHTPAVRKI